MSLVLKISGTIPPGGWSYTQSDSGLVITGGNYAELRERVRQHRDNNRFFNGPQLDEEIQTQICERIPENDRASWCVDPSVMPPPGVPVRSVAVGDVRNFLHMLGAWIKTGFKFVGQPEAERRAAICTDCPKNVEIAGCAGCAHIAPLLTQTIGHRYTPFDQKLKGCEVCGCANQAQIWIPLEVLDQGSTPQMDFPDWCWKGKNR